MTLEEAQTIADIIVNADGGCSSCVETLREMCEGSFPQFIWKYRDKTEKENEDWDWGPKIQVMETYD